MCVRKRLTKAKLGYEFKIREKDEGQEEYLRGLIPLKGGRWREMHEADRANRWHQWIETVVWFGKCSWSGWNWKEEEKTETIAGTHICPEDRLNTKWFLQVKAKQAIYLTNNH